MLFLTYPGVWLRKENWAGRRQKQALLRLRRKTGICWLTWGWTNCNVFSSAEVQILCWVYITQGAVDLCWDSNCECQHHQVASELPPSIRLVWISSELLCPENYAHRHPEFTWDDWLVLTSRMWEHTLRALSSIAEMAFWLVSKFSHPDNHKLCLIYI